MSLTDTLTPQILCSSGATPGPGVFRSEQNEGMKRFCNLLLVVFVAVFSQTALAEPIEPPRQPVEKLNARLIDVMKDAKRLGYAGRYKKLEPVVQEVFQFEAIAQIALGSHWNNLDPSQKQTFIAKLTELSIATYASQFDAYDGQTFRYDSTEATKPDRAIVRYTMLAPNGKPVKFDYILNQSNGQWAIINIIVDGISDLALKKAQYTSVIDREGFNSLMNKLSQKITDYASKNTSSG